MGHTMLEQAKAGIITDEMKRVAAAEGVEPERLRDLVATGFAVIPKNSGRDFPLVKAIGKGLSTKVNANLGTSDECADLAFERDERISRARERLDWETITAEALDPVLVRMRSKTAVDREACTMCGKLCAVKLSRRHPD